MTARQIASHRYGHSLQPYSSSLANHELLAEYKNLLLDHHASTIYERYLKLLCQLLQCESAVFLLSIDDSGKEVARYGGSEESNESFSSFGRSFLKFFRDTKLAYIDDIDEVKTAKGHIWRADYPSLRSYAAVPIVVGKLELGLLIVSNECPYQWLPDKLESLKDMSQMLCADLETTRERHLIAVQRRMQRSLVQFVRGNLTASNDRTEIPEHRYTTKSLYSDLDEDLEVEDADDEADQIETSKMNVMFDFSARLIRRTLKVAGCVLIDIENIADLENIEAEFPSRSTIMGACFLRHLRSAGWHEKQMGHQSSGSGSSFVSSIDSDTLTDKSVDRRDIFDPRGLSGPWLRQLLEDHPRAVAFDESSLPEAIKTLLPAGLRRCLISPIYDSNAKAFALIVVFNDQCGDFTKADCHYIEAFGSSIYAEVLNQSLQRANEAKSLFISKISHEFRTPLHGVLASAEFLNDMADTTPAQLGFVQTIDTCSRTLLDIINHVLDYSKLSLGNSVLQAETSADMMSVENFDAVEVAEQVLSTAFSSYEFKRINDHIDVQKSNSQQSRSDSDSGSLTDFLGRNLEVIIQATPRSQGYTIKSDLGAYRRIVLNLLGNALKYTHQGHVIMKIGLSPIEESPGLEQLEIAISDTGVGIATTFLIEMFRPFSQEDNFSAGTGLGLSIVKELCTKMHGKIDVKTTKHTGSKFTVTYPVIPQSPPLTLFPGAGIRRDLKDVRFHYLTTVSQSSAAEARSTVMLQNSIVSQLEGWFGMCEVSYDEAQILVTDDTGFECAKDDIQTFSGPILTLCSTTAKYEQGRRSRPKALQVLVTKPCGPYKLGAALSACIAHASNLSRLDLNLETLNPLDSSQNPSSPTLSAQAAPRSPICSATPPSPPTSYSSTVRGHDTRQNITGGARRTIREEQDERSLAELYDLHQATRLQQRNEVSGKEQKPRQSTIPHHFHATDSAKPQDTSEQEQHQAISKEPLVQPVEPSAPQPDQQLQNSEQRKYHILVVEDNPINMMLLVAFAKQHGLAATTAGNGRLAYERVKGRTRNYDAILMDINMPVCNGFEATQMIRDFEAKAGRERTKVAALTGLSSVEDQQKAMRSGADAFFTKPVKMKELAHLMLEWGVETPSLVRHAGTVA